MAKKSIDLCILVTSTDGQETLHKIMKLPTPDVSKIRTADKKEQARTEHIKYLQNWVKKAINSQIVEDENPSSTENLDNDYK